MAALLAVTIRAGGSILLHNGNAGSKALSSLRRRASAVKPRFGYSEAMRALLPLALLISATAFSQTPVFEEASIKPAKPGVTGKPIDLTSAGGMIATHVSAGRLIQMSYNRMPFLIFGLSAARAV